MGKQFKPVPDVECLKYHDNSENTNIKNFAFQIRTNKKQPFCDIAGKNASSKNRNPKLSVVTPVYNTENVVHRCLDSIVRQSYSNVELIVVNNGSSGNIEEIVNRYKKRYPNYEYKLVEIEKNQGLVFGYMSGAEVATGNYIAFIDSDDRVSLDFYRRLIETAILNDADMVATDFVYEYDDGTQMTDGYNPIPSLDIQLEDEAILQNFMSHGARSFYWNLMWNKVYSMELWKKSSYFLKKADMSIVFAQDIVFSLVLCAFSKKFVNIHDVKYYYYKRKGSATDSNGSIDAFEKQINDLKKIFAFFREFLGEIYGDLYDIEFEEWKKRYFRFFCDFVSYSKLEYAEKEYLYAHLKEVFDESEISHRTSQDNFFQRFQTPYNDGLEEHRQQIYSKKFSVISFDIFDTLILRPFWNPRDIFEMLSVYYNRLVKNKSYVDFSMFREGAEKSLKIRNNTLGGWRYHYVKFTLKLRISYNLQNPL